MSCSTCCWPLELNGWMGARSGPCVRARDPQCGGDGRGQAFLSIRSIRIMVVCAATYRESGWRGDPEVKNRVSLFEG